MVSERGDGRDGAKGHRAGHRDLLEPAKVSESVPMTTKLPPDPGWALFQTGTVRVAQTRYRQSFRGSITTISGGQLDLIGRSDVPTPLSYSPANLMAPLAIGILRRARGISNGCRPASAEGLGQADLAAVGVAAQIEVYAAGSGLIVQLGTVSEQHLEAPFG